MVTNSFNFKNKFLEEVYLHFVDVLDSSKGNFKFSKEPNHLRYSLIMNHFFKIEFLFNPEFFELIVVYRDFTINIHNTSTLYDKVNNENIEYYKNEIIDIISNKTRIKEIFYNSKLIEIQIDNYKENDIESGFFKSKKINKWFIFPWQKKNIEIKEYTFEPWIKSEFTIK